MPSKDPFPHSPRHQALLWSAALALIALGAYLSQIRFLDEEWLSRAGCAVVMLGIWSGLGAIVQERVVTGRLRWRRRHAIMRARARLSSQDADPAAIEEEISGIEDAFDKKSAELTDRLKLSLGILEVSLLITGTFFWGFGDLLVK